MNHFTVPKWNQRQQRQEQVAAEEGNTSCDHVPMSSYEVAELTWENGQLAMHDLSRKWAGDTLECIVDQATRDRPNHKPDENLKSLAAPWGEKRSKKRSSNIVASSSRNEGTLEKKRTRTESEQNGSACASASATFCRDNNTDTTMMTWTSFEPPQSFKSARIGDDDSSLHTCSEKQDEEGGSKSDDGTGSRSSKRHSRAADKHNQSERRRRDRINQKMKALQKLVPNANKSDKASMLDEVIAYLKQLQAQVQVMSARTMMMMPQSRTMTMMPQPQPLLTQHHLQMSLLARLGMGMGMGMGMNNIAHHQSIPSYLHSPFVAPPNRPSLPFNDPYCTFLAQQSMNMDFYNKMEALYQQRINNSLQEQVSSTLTNNVQQGG